MTNPVKFAVAGLLIVAAVVFLIVRTTADSARYFMTVTELQALGPEAQTRDITVSGAIPGDSIRYDPTQPRVTFALVQIPGDPQEVERAGGLATVLHRAANDPTAPRLEVVYDQIKPDLLRHEAQAIIRGRLGEDGRFHADEVLLKCPSRYEEAVPGQSDGSS